MNDKVTTRQYGAYQGAFDHFNEQLFSGQLPPVMLNFCRSNKKSYGFYTLDARWKPAFSGGPCHEISLNPGFLGRDPKLVLSTLVHEMVHHWQHAFGKPGRGPYHNKEWADKMDSIGLPPTVTGQEGGKRTGQRVTHMIARGGAFERAFDGLPYDYLLPWVCAPPEEQTAKAKSRDKVKYTCPGCGTNLWGKPGLRVVCEECEQRFVKAS